MGMDLSVDYNIIDKITLDNLKSGKNYINKYDLTTQSKDYIDNIYKSFFFDILLKINNESIWKEEDLFNYMKINWQDLLSIYDIDICLPEEISEDAYITFEEWNNFEDVYDYPCLREVIIIDEEKFLLLEARYW